MKIRIDIEPVAKGRPKTTLRNGTIWTYTPKRTQDAEAAIRQSVDGIKPFLAGIPLKMVVTFYRQKSQWLKKHEDKPFRKPDLDNLFKCLCDALNGKAFADDSQLTTVLMRKRWTKKSQALSCKRKRTPDCRGYIIVNITEDKGV